MTPNATYEALASMKTVNSDDQVVELVKGKQYLCAKFDELIDSETAEVFRVPTHMARNPGWYFHKVGELRQPHPSVSHEDYVRELVRGTPGLLGRCYFDMGIMEGWFPCGRHCASNASFTATLSKLGFEMRDTEGNVVKGIKHGARDCTYHVKSVKKNLDGLFAA